MIFNSHDKTYFQFMNDDTERVLVSEMYVVLWDLRIVES